MCTHTSEVHTRKLSSFSFHKHATKEILTHSKGKVVHSNYTNTSIHMVLNLFQVKLLRKEKCQEPYLVLTTGFRCFWSWRTLASCFCRNKSFPWTPLINGWSRRCVTEGRFSKSLMRHLFTKINEQSKYYLRHLASL